MESLNIQDKAKRVIDFSNIGFDCGDFFHPIGNFSIIPYNGMYLASFRRFAYHITTEWNEYVTMPALKLNDPHKQLFCLLDRDFNFVKQIPCSKSTYWEDPKFNRRIPYLEDMRMVQWDGCIYGISSIFYMNDTRYERFGLEFQKVEVQSDGMVVCGGVECQHVWNSIEHGIMGRYKNWCPLPDKPFKFVSGTWKDGTQLFDMATGKFIDGGIVGGEEGLFRGNAPLLKTDFGYMGITHMLDYDERKRKRYNNFLVEYNADLSVCRISRPFKLTSSNIEFITTFMELPNDELFIGYTVMDDTPMGIVFSKNELVSNVLQ